VPEIAGWVVLGLLSAWWPAPSWSRG